MIKTGRKLVTIYCPYRKRRKVFNNAKWHPILKRVNVWTDEPAEILERLERLAPDAAFTREIKNEIKHQPKPESRAGSATPKRRKRKRNSPSRRSAR